MQRAEWTWGGLVAVATTALGVVINLATEQLGNVWLWVAVVVISVGFGVATVYFGRASSGPKGSGATADQVESGSPVSGQQGDSSPSVRNSISGKVEGTVVQAGTIEGGVNLGQSGRARGAD